MSRDQPVRVVIADDHPMLRYGLTAALAATADRRAAVVSRSPGWLRSGQFKIRLLLPGMARCATYRPKDRLTIAPALLYHRSR